MKTKCCICDKYIDDEPCPHQHTQLEVERATKRAVRKTAISNNVKLSNEFERNAILIEKLSCELEQIEVEIEMAAAEGGRK